LTSRDLTIAPPLLRTLDRETDKGGLTSWGFTFGLGRAWEQTRENQRQEYVTHTCRHVEIGLDNKLIPN